MAPLAGVEEEAEEEATDEAVLLLDPPDEDCWVEVTVAIDSEVSLADDWADDDWAAEVAEDEAEEEAPEDVAAEDPLAVADAEPITPPEMLGAAIVSDGSVRAP